MLRHFTYLDQTQLKALDELCSACYQVDGHHIAIYRHLLSLPRPIPCNLLYYEGTELLGFLRPFFFDVDQCEIALMVHPEHRRQGIATQLLQTSLPLIQSEGAHQLIASSPHELNTLWFKQRAFQYQHSEYKMVYPHDGPPILSPSQHNLTIRIANHADIPVLAELDKHCFPNETVMSHSRFTELTSSAQCDLMVIEQNQQVVGKAHLNYETDCTRLTDIAVDPIHQGLGIGTALINACIQRVLMLQKPALVLDVETKNKQALHLYQKLNFIVINACDFWEIDLDK